MKITRRELIILGLGLLSGYGLSRFGKKKKRADYDFPQKKPVTGVFNMGEIGYTFSPADAVSSPLDHFKTIYLDYSSLINNERFNLSEFQSSLGRGLKEAAKKGANPKEFLKHFKRWGTIKKFFAFFLEEAYRREDVVQLALEPSRGWPGVIKEDTALNEFASMLAESKVPVLIRFASEMNGAWTPYHKPVKEYIKAFRTVAKVIHKNAPKAKMLWSPFPIQAANADYKEYYPGDKYVDLIGISAYFTPIFPDNELIADKEKTPEELADIILKPTSEFAKEKGKPFIISEWAAACRYDDKNTEKDWSDFQKETVRKMYKNFLPQYDVKAICYFNADLIDRNNKTSKNKSWKIDEGLYEESLSEIESSLLSYFSNIDFNNPQNIYHRKGICESFG